MGIVVILQRIYSKTTRWQSQINVKTYHRVFRLHCLTIYSRDGIYSDVCMCASVCMYGYVYVLSKNEGKLAVAAFVDAIRGVTVYSVCVTVTYPYDIRPFTSVPQQRRNGRTIRS